MSYSEFSYSFRFVSVLTDCELPTFLFAKPTLIASNMPSPFFFIICLIRVVCTLQRQRGDSNFHSWHPLSSLFLFGPSLLSFSSPSRFSLFCLFFFTSSLFSFSVPFYSRLILHHPPITSPRFCLICNLFEKILVHAKIRRSLPKAFRHESIITTKSKYWPILFHITNTPCFHYYKYQSHSSHCQGESLAHVYFLPFFIIKTHEIDEHQPANISSRLQILNKINKNKKSTKF